MNKQNIVYWIFFAFAALFGIIVIGFGINLVILGKNCRSYADLGCAFGAMFSLVVIPYGMINLLFIGLVNLPFKVASLIGSILSALSGLFNFGFSCFILLGALGSNGSSPLSNNELPFFLFPLFIFLYGITLFGVGSMGFVRSK